MTREQPAVITYRPIFASSILAAVGNSASRPPRLPDVDNDCLFCRIVAGEIPATVVRETPTILAFRDIAPQAPVHVLVISKDHHANVAALAVADPAVAGDLLAAIAAVASAEGLSDSGFRVILNTGRHAGMEVAHVHAHVLGGGPLGPMLAG